MVFRKLVRDLVIGLLLAIPSGAMAQSRSCDGYQLLSETIASAGGRSSGGNYSLLDISGQAAVAKTGGPLYLVSAGNADAFKDPLPIWSTYLAWKQAFFTPAQQGDPSISGPLADFDLDDFFNLLEYATGSDPTSGLSAAHPVPVVDPMNAALSYTRRISATDVTFAVEVSSNLVTWTSTTPVNEVVCNDGFIQTIRAQVPAMDIDPTGKVFLRLRVTLP